jgi:hypothetical protein
MRRFVHYATLVAAGAAAIALLAGCSSGVQFVREHPVEYAEKADNAPIEVMTGGTERPHVVIGTLTAKQTMKATFNDRSTYDSVLTKLKDEARKVGADALIYARPVSAQEAGPSTEVIVTAQAIKFMEREDALSSRDSN